MSFCSPSNNKLRTHCTFSSCTEHQKKLLSFRTEVPPQPPFQIGQGVKPWRYLATRSLRVSGRSSQSHGFIQTSLFSHTMWKQKRNLFPDTIQPTAIHWYPPPTPPCTRDIHLLASNRICLKVPVYCPGVVPKHHAPNNTPFILVLFFCVEVFLFL